MALNVYTRVGDFSEDEASNKGGRSTVDTAQLDAELDAVKSVLDDARTKLAAIQRDDLKLNDDVLLGHEFSAAALSLLGGVLSTGTLVFRGEWATATAYAVRDVVSVTGIGAFICVTAHTAPGAFAASPNWQQLAADGAASVPRGVVAVSSDIAIDASHNNKTLETTGVRTLTLPLASSMTDGFAITVAPASGSAMLTRSGTETIDGATSVTVAYSAQGTQTLSVQVNAARTGWRVIEYKGAGAAGALATWNGTALSTIAPTMQYQEAVAISPTAVDFVGNEVSAAKTAAYTVTTDDHKDIVRCNASGGAFTVNLPSGASLAAGFRTTLIKTDSSPNAVTVDGYLAETINGQASIILVIPYEFITVLWDGAEWLIVEDGRKALYGSNTLNLAAGATSSFDVTHGFGTDDVDVDFAAYTGTTTTTWSAHVTGASGHGFVKHGGSEPASVPVASVPNSGLVRFAVRNNDTVTHNAFVRYRISRRSA